MNEKFEKLGVGEVRARIESKVFLGAEASLAREWLARQDAKSADEILALTRDSNYQSRMAASEARRANWIAGAALVIAVLSAIVAVAATVHGWR
jgi:hypothetical protein